MKKRILHLDGDILILISFVILFIATVVLAFPTMLLCGLGGGGVLVLCLLFPRIQILAVLIFIASSLFPKFSPKSLFVIRLLRVVSIILLLYPIILLLPYF